VIGTGDGQTGQVTDRQPDANPRPGPDDQPVLPETSSDERHVGWGDEPSERDDDWYRRERPPHHE
jgi:hypothetical protein